MAEKLTMSEWAAKLGKARWADIPKAERGEHVPRSGGRPAKYPQCSQGKYHRFNQQGRCKCGYKRKA